MITAIRRILILLAFLFLYGHSFAVNHHCEVIKYNSFYEIRNDNRIYETDSIVIQINDRTGEEYTQIKLGYSKSNPIISLSAWIENNYGTVVRVLKNKEIVDANAVSSSFYTDYFTKSFILKHNEYPYRVCYTYQKTCKQFYHVANWSPLIGTDVPTLKAKLVFIHPENYKVHILQNLIDPPAIATESGILFHTWSASYDGSFENEVFSPEPERFLPYIRIIPENFNYGMQGCMNTWQSFGNWQFNINKGMDELPEAEKSEVAKQIFNIHDKKEIIRKLYHYMQDRTHYVSVNIGIGGLKPYPASYVALNKFGDCKALTVYMKALLNAAGINSYYVLVNAGTQPLQIYTDTPNQQFNHAVLAVPVENDTLWLENTSNYEPFDYAGLFIQNRLALLIDENHSRLVKIPALKSEEVMTTRNMDFIITPEGSSDVSLRYVLRGYEFEFYNELISNYTLDDQNRIVHNRLPFPDFDLKEWRIIKNGRDQKSLILLASITLNRIINSLGKEYYFSYQPLHLPDFEPPRERKLPVQISYPVHQSDTLRYLLPDGKHITDLPKGKVIESNYGKYAIEFHSEGQIVLIHREFQLYPATISPDEYEHFHDFITSIKTEEKQKILFQ